jgi:polysaccharide export outer membrane protein
LRYKIRKGDTFDLDFPLSPEFNQTLAVQPDGYVSLKAAGSMVVEGQTVPQLEESIKRAYAKVLHDPIVSISLRDFDKPFFIAAGQVSKPGKYDLRGDITVTQAVAIAGGFNQNAKHSQVVLFRPAADGHYEATVLNIKKLLASHNLSEDVCLRPGDMLYVPQSAYSHIRPFLPSSVVGAYYNPAFN